MNKDFKLGELFCGPGGIARGALDSSLEYKGATFKITPTWASDYDKETCETFSRNIHGQTLSESTDSVFHGDVRELDILGLPKCDGLAFGFPCNDFSIVGESKGLEGPFGPLYTYGVKYLREHQPDWFIAENVGGLRSSNQGKAFELIISELKESGYNLTPNLYKFEDYGVPQARHRLIIVGIRNNLNLTFKVPAPTHKDNHVTSFDAISYPPISKDSHNHDFTSHLKGVVARLEHIKPGDNPTFFLQDPDNDSWSGIYVHDTSIDPDVGDKLELAGTVNEYYSFTQLEPLTSYSVNSENNSLEIKDINTFDIYSDPDAPSSDTFCSESGEEVESMLVRISNVTVVKEANEYGEWYVDDGSGPCAIDDGTYTSPLYNGDWLDPNNGEFFDNIVGVVTYGYGRPRILPRDPNDFCGNGSTIIKSFG